MYSPFVWSSVSHTHISIGLVQRLSEKIVHILIKAPNLVQHLLNSYYFILDMVPLKLLIISCSKNLKSKINRKCIGEAIKVPWAGSIVNILKLYI